MSRSLKKMMNGLSWDDSYTIAERLEHRRPQAKVPGSSPDGGSRLFLQTFPICTFPAYICPTIPCLTLLRRSLVRVLVVTVDYFFRFFPFASFPQTRVKRVYRIRSLETLKRASTRFAKYSKYPMYSVLHQAFLLL